MREGSLEEVTLNCLKGGEVGRCSIPARESSEKSPRSEGRQGWWGEKGLF